MDREKKWEQLSEIVKMLTAHYVATGGAESELSVNSQMVYTRQRGRIDRTLDRHLAECITRQQVKYLKSKRAESKNRYELESAYYITIAHFSTWCSVQHAACGSLMSAVESAGKALGYYEAAKEILSARDSNLAMFAAAQTEEEFLEEQNGAIK